MEGLPTLEKVMENAYNRYKLKALLMTNLVDDFYYCGNAFASESELQSLSEINLQCLVLMFI